MPFNALLLPLLGGYVFITNWNRTRFNTKRYSGERLLFHSAAAGVVFLAASFVAGLAIRSAVPQVYELWQRAVPFPYTGTSVGAFLLGTLCWVPMNRWLYSREQEIRRAITEWNDYLEVLLERAMRDSKQVSVSAKNDKVYIGLVTNNFDPAYERRYIRILPMSSGYRKAETRELVLTTDYAAVYDLVLQENPSFVVEAVESFQIVIPVAEVASASLFDPAVYERFKAADPAVSDKAA
jgi:hypothetical protein